MISDKLRRRRISALAILVLQPALGLTLALAVTPPASADVTGKVVSVIDGDSLTVLHNGKAEHVPLQGIDCPEKGQAYGKNATQVASALIFGKEVTRHTSGKDRYGRTLADVLRQTEPM